MSVNGLSLAALGGATAAAVSCSLSGTLLVLRDEVFTADALSHAAFAGGVGALAGGADPRIGLVVGPVVVAVFLAWAGMRGRADDVVIGSVFSFVLGVGVLFLRLATVRSVDVGAGMALLFGSVSSLGGGEALVLGGLAAAVAGGLALVGRPLLLTTLDEEAARALGLPVRGLEITFLVLLALAVAAGTATVGALLVLLLLAAPAGAARHLAVGSAGRTALAVAIGVGGVWLGSATAVLVGRLPTSSAVSIVLALAHLGASVRRRVASGPASGRAA